MRQSPFRSVDHPGEKSFEQHGINRKQKNFETRAIPEVMSFNIGSPRRLTASRSQICMGLVLDAVAFEIVHSVTDGRDISSVLIRYLQLSFARGEFFFERHY